MPFVITKDSRVLYTPSTIRARDEALGGGSVATIAEAHAACVSSANPRPGWLEIHDVRIGGTPMAPVITDDSIHPSVNWRDVREAGSQWNNGSTEIAALYSALNAFSVA